MEQERSNSPSDIAIEVEGDHGRTDTLITIPNRISLQNKPSAYYTFKIKRFSLLLQAIQSNYCDYYTSSTFNAGGYKWKLHLYPNGDERSNGDGYISFYLVITDTDRLPIGWEINVEFTLFVYNHFWEEYFTIHDPEARYNQTHTINGFSRLISQAIFNDASNGYLVNDNCIFGADLFVFPKKTRKVESLLATWNPQDGVYTWESYTFSEDGVYTWVVSNFSKINLQSHCSPPFSAAGKKWIIEIFQSEKQGEKYLSLYLYLVNKQTNYFNFTFPSWLRKRNDDLYVESTIRVRDQKHRRDMKRTVCRDFSVKSSCVGYGFKEFMPMDKLSDQSKGFLVNDSLIIDVEFDLGREVKKML